MNNRKLIFWLLVGSIVAVSANLFVRFYVGAPSSSIESGRVLLNTDFNPRIISIAYNDGFEVKMINDLGWKLIEPYSASLDGQNVMQLVDSFLFSPVIDSINERDVLQKYGRTREDYGLASPKIQVVFSDGDESVGVSVGEITASSNGVYASVDGSGSIYVLKTNCYSLIANGVDSFRKHELLDVPVESIVGVELKRQESDKIATFTRTKEGWKTETGNVSDAKLESFLIKIAESRIITYVWPTGKNDELSAVSGSLLAGYGLNPESASVIIFKCEDGVDRKVLFGAAADDKTVYALVQNGSAIVTVNKELKDVLLQKDSYFTDLRVFPFEPTEVTRFSIVDGDDSYSLIRDSTGEWSLDAPVSAKADNDAVESCLRRILSITATDKVDGAFVLVNVNGVEKNVLASKIKSNGFSYATLRSLEMIKLDSVAIRRIVVTMGNGGQIAVLFSQDTMLWKVERGGASGEMVDGKVIAELLRIINPLKAERTVALKVHADELGKYGFDKPYCVLAIDHVKSDIIRRNIIIGAEADGGRYATVGSSDAVFVISEETIKGLCKLLMSKQ